MKMKGLITVIAILVVGQASANSDRREIMKERKKEARENIEEMNRADEVIEEDQREEAREAEHPYERIDPKSKNNLFEEMQSGNKGPPSPDL